MRRISGNVWFLSLIVLAAVPAQASFLDDLLKPGGGSPQAATPGDPMEQLHKAFGPECTDPEMTARLARIVAQLKPQMTHPKIAERVQAHVFENDQLNAFACPDGTLVVLSGMMRFTEGKDDMLAAVVGHELGHIDCQHGRPSGKSTIGNILHATGIGGDIGGLLIEHVLANESQDNEYEADRCGLQYMMLSRQYPPDGALLLQRGFLERFGSGVGLDAYFGSHPPGPARVRHLQSALPGLFLDFGSRFPAARLPKAGFALAPGTKPEKLEMELVNLANKCCQMTAGPVTVAGDATVQAALAEAENQKLDLLVWCGPEGPQDDESTPVGADAAGARSEGEEATKPVERRDSRGRQDKQTANGVTVDVYDVPTGLVLTHSVVAHRSGDNKHDEVQANAESVMLALLANRSWREGGGSAVILPEPKPDVLPSAAVAEVATQAPDKPAPSAQPTSSPDTPQPTPPPDGSGKGESAAPPQVQVPAGIPGAPPMTPGSAQGGAVQPPAASSTPSGNVTTPAPGGTPPKAGGPGNGAPPPGSDGPPPTPGPAVPTKLGGSAAPQQVAGKTPIELNGAHVTKRDGEFFVPIVPIVEHFGGTARFAAATGDIRADIRQPWPRFLVCRAGETVASCNDGEIRLPASPYTDNGRAMVPLKALERLRFYWSWEGHNLALRLGETGQAIGLLPMP